MSKYEKLLGRLLGCVADANFSFDDLCYILHRLRFDEKVNGGHHIFARDGIEEQLNLQRYRGSKDAKPYQVRQVRSLLLKYDLSGGMNDDKV
jgi:hypothetical protein